MKKNGTLNFVNEEERCYSDIIKQIKRGERAIYIYNKIIVERLQKQFPDLTIEKVDFYWVVRNAI